MDKNSKRFLSVDKIYSTYERTRNFKKIFGVTRKGKVGGLRTWKKEMKDRFNNESYTNFYTRKRIW